MMRRLMMVVAACFASAGCDQGSPPDPSSADAAVSVAVMDVDAVARALGRDEVFKEQVEAAGRQLQQQLTAFSSELEEKLREEQARFGDDPTGEERRELARMAADAQRQIQQGTALARQKALEFHNKLAADFRAEIKPTAARVAQRRGASAVIPSNTFLWFDPGADITDEVIDELRAKGVGVGGPRLAPSDSSADGARQ